MKDWQKRRDIESLNNPQTRSFINGWNEGRTDTLAELSFVRDSLEKICHVGIITCDDCERAIQIAVATLSRLDALTWDGEEKFNNEGEKK